MVKLAILVNGKRYEVSVPKKNLAKFLFIESK